MDVTSQDKLEEAKKPLAWRKQYTSIALVLGAILVMVLAMVFGRRLANFQKYGLLGVWLTSVIGTTAPVWVMPGWLAAFIGGSLWNPLLVALAAGSGEVIGESIGYMGGRGGRIVVEKFRFYPRLESWMKRRGWLVVFLFAGVPNPVTKLGMATAGALRYPFWRFFILVWVAKVLKSLGFALAGFWGLTSLMDLIHRIFG